MRIKDETKIVLRKNFGNGNYVIREFITHRKGVEVQIIRSIEVTNRNLKKQVYEFNVNKEHGNLAFKNNLKQGFTIINNI